MFRCGLWDGGTGVRRAVRRARLRAPPAPWPARPPGHGSAAARPPRRAHLPRQHLDRGTSESTKRPAQEAGKAPPRAGRLARRRPFHTSGLARAAAGTAAGLPTRGRADAAGCGTPPSPSASPPATYEAPRGYTFHAALPAKSLLEPQPGEEPTIFSCGFREQRRMQGEC